MNSPATAAVMMPTASGAQAGERRVRWELLVIPLALAHVVIFLLPLTLFAYNALLQMTGPALVGGALSMRNFWAVILDPYYQRAFTRSLYLSALTALGTLTLGYPVAYLLSRSRALWTRLVLLILVSSVFVSLVVRTLGWKTVLDENGMIGRLVAAIPLVGGSIKLLNTPLGILVGLVHTELPFMILILLPVLQGISPSLEEAAAGLGAGRAVILWRILLPLSLPGILAGCLLVFSVSMGLYVPPALLGNLVATVPTLIYSETMVALNYPMAAALSTVLAVIVLLTVAVAGTLAARSASPRG